jgi:GxxExxY protein
MEFDVLSRKVIGCAIEVHKHLGPGLLESAYEQCLGYELQQSCIAFARQVPLQVEYKDMRLDCGYRADLVLNDQLVVELKSVDKLQRIHEAQLLTYMKIAKIHTGLLINFNVNLLKSGIKRFVL